MLILMLQLNSGSGNLGSDPHWEEKLDRFGDTQTKHCHKNIKNSKRTFLVIWKATKDHVTHLDNVVAGELSDESGTLPVLGMAQAQLTSLIP